ncbi:hypothetical protein BXZ70DRAFT_1013195 [Cristinia sonorae]|uniref:Uncharacterized protein n=1 Tax=Cristinia sonorae TaxID=1940300 RepID=A0A8K0XK19_9AGAR|nr:hypothetical protein BXZ70DRAFT_1013195 [Cristinia sonorae]
MPYVFPARYQMEFTESSPLEKSSKGQSFVTRLLFTGEKGAERLTLSVILEVQNPSNRFFGGRRNRDLNGSPDPTHGGPLVEQIPDYLRPGQTLDSQATRSSTNWRKWTWKDKVIAFYSLQHRSKLAGLIFRLRYYHVIFSNGYSSYLTYMKFIDDADLMLDEKHNVLGYNVEMEMLEEMEQEEENEEDEEYEDEEDWDYRDYDNA